jgi:hypothetical protein
MVTEAANISLINMGRGTTIYLIGTVVSLLIGFITRTLIARYGTEAQYGVYSYILVSDFWMEPPDISLSTKEKAITIKPS